MLPNALQRTVLAVTLVVLSATATAAITTVTVGTWSGECVSYARSRVPRLPYGLFTLTDKKKIINSYTCRAGSVAIIDAAAPYGHVAVVEACDASGSTQGIRIAEANWKRGYITRRTSQVSGTIKQAEKELRIIGYFRP